MDLGLQKIASRFSSIPLLNFVSPSGAKVPRDEILQQYLRCQKLAQQAAVETAKLVKEGWTEIQAATMLETYLRDSGVHAFFHAGFAWFGERSRFSGMRTYQDFMPSRRVILPGEPFILDVAPIFHGFTSDIGYTTSLGENTEVTRAKKFLSDLREQIPGLFVSGQTGAEIWERVDELIEDAGYHNVYQRYPFGVLGHRLYHLPENYPKLKLYNFGWQSFWGLLSRGLFGQLLSRHFEGDLTGIWAIEPHIGAKDFGAKFEEILLVTPEGARWLEKEMV